MSRLFRCLVCFLLIGCILVNLSPLKAEALTAELAVIGVSASLVIIPIIIGLGVMPGSESSTAFDELVDGCKAALTSAGFVVDGLVNVFSLTNSQYRYAVNVDLIEWVHNWLYESGSIIASGNYVFADYAGYGDLMLESWEKALGYPSHCVGYRETSENWYIFYTNGTITYTPDGEGYMLSSNQTLYYYQIHQNGTRSFSTFSAGLSVGPYVNVSIDGITHDVSTQLDLTLGLVAAPSVGFDTGYSSWQRAAEDDDSFVYPPVSLPIQRTEEESKDMTQEEVWDGTATYEDTITDSEAGTDTGTDAGTETGLLSSILSAVKAIPAAFTDWFDSLTTGLTGVLDAVISLPAAIADVFKPSASVDHFSISLSDYFPFCIPFDLYDFFVCLNADPEAPVIDWLIPFPGTDGFKIELDLSSFDSVAQLLRTLQLLLFCVGLAFKTRDLIKG